MKNTHYNSAKIAGCMVKDFSFSHASTHAKYYKGVLAVERTSGTVDFLSVVVPLRVWETLPTLKDKLVEISGQISTCHHIVDGSSRLVVDLFAHTIEVLENGEHTNDVVLRGVVCKAPAFRVTPMGREICDMMLAVNRSNGRTAYIPCIAWGRDARALKSVRIGAMLEVRGRLQSREYDKVYEDGTVEKRTVYEVSVSKVVTEAE